MKEMFDQIILFAEYYIYKCRIDKIKPRSQSALKELRNKYRMEKFNHSVEMTLPNFI